MKIDLEKFSDWEAIGSKLILMEKGLTFRRANVIPLKIKT